MALSGTISKSITGRTYKIVWSASQSVTGNYSYITCYHYLVNDSSYSLYINSRSNTCTVDGTSESYTSSSISTSGGSTIHLGTTYHTVYHNSDGSKSTTISGTFNIQATLSGTYYSSLTASATVTLDTIARASSITSATDVTIDGNTASTVKWTAATSSFSHKIRFRVLDYNSGWIDIASGSTSYTYNSYKIPLDWLNSNTDKTTFSLAVDLHTYNGSTKIGESTKIFYGTAGSAANPTCTLTTTRTGQSTLACYIDGKSGVTLTATPSTKYGATVTDISFYNGTKLLQSGTSTTCSTDSLGSGTLTLKAVVTDTRGYSVTTTKSITVYSYSAPSVSSLTAYRTSSSSSTDQNNAGTYGYAKAVFLYSSCGGLNSLSASTIQYRATTASTWSTFKSGAVSGTGYWVSGLAVASDYEVRVLLTDKFGSVYSQVVTITGSFKLLSFNGKLGGLALGMVSSAAGFVSNMVSTFKKSVTLESTLDVSGAATLGSTLDVDGTIQATGSISTSNYVSLGSHNASGDFRSLALINTSSNTYFGHGSYTNSEGSTYYEGNTVGIQSKGNIYMTSPTAGLSARAYGVNKVLATTASYLNASQTITLSEAVSAQPNGIVLVWSYYNGEANNFNFSFFFVPKYQASAHSACGICCYNFNVDHHMIKYVYIYDTKITGYSYNTGSHTIDGVTFYNSNYVLRYVIGV